jgi:hypothetical protein
MPTKLALSGRDAPMSPALACRRIIAMVRPCQCSSKAAISASKPGQEWVSVHASFHFFERPERYPCSPQSVIGSSRRLLPLLVISIVTLWLGGCEGSDCLAGQAEICCHERLSRNIALRIVMSLRATATRAMSFGFPAATSLSRKLLSCGL